MVAIAVIQELQVDSNVGDILKHVLMADKES